LKELQLDDILEQTSDLSKKKKVWYVAIIGRPNAGKSTFINALIGEKISITSNIPQTTRKKVLAIYNDEKAQIVFFDTPWIHFEEKMFNKEINNQAISTLRDSELVLYFIDSSRKSWEEEKYIQKILENVSVPIFKIYTKRDLKSQIDIPSGENIFEISSVSKTWFETLIEKITEILPRSQLLYPEDFYTKQDMFFRVSEIIREKVFTNTKEEIPHSIFISVEEIQDTPPLTSPSKGGGNSNGLLKIVAYINAESDSQKYILIGSKWSLIAKMWKQSRIELEQVFWKKVFLALRVKVKKNWRKDERVVKGILG